MSSHRKGNSHHHAHAHPRSNNACHDCGQPVPGSFKEHHAVCPKSRLQRSLLPQASVLPSPSSTLVTPKASGADFYFLLDVSGSMAGPNLENAKQLASALLGGLQDHDRMAIITFDTSPFFKLKPRPAGEVQRKQEIPGLMSRIFARGGTALYDAIWMAAEQMRDPQRRTVILVLTDGEDNSSKKTLGDVYSLANNFPNLVIHLIQIGGTAIQQHVELTQRFRGEFQVQMTVNVEVTMNFALSNIFEV